MAAVTGKDDRRYRRIMTLSALVFVTSIVCLVYQLETYFSIHSGAVSSIIPLVTTSMILAAAASIFAEVKARSGMREMRKLAFLDELTGLPNRRQFNAELEAELNRCKKSQSNLGLLILDLDRFKVINDCHGHEVGDEIIRQFGQRIKGCLRKKDLLGRMAGDEFLAMITDVESEDDLLQVGERIIEFLREPFNHAGRQILAGVSIGGVIVENGEHDVLSAIRMADFALLRSKEQGRRRFLLFDPKLAASVKRRTEMESLLREAIATDGFTLKYLPSVEPGSGNVVGVEALVRWFHPIQGEIAPSEFIPLAEEFGLIDEIGEVVLARACQEIGPIGELRLSVNVASTQFLKDDFVEKVEFVLEQTGFAAGRLELEIPEKLLVSNAEVTKQALARLRDLGVRVALDDFGTGYSSMSYLRDFQLDRIKIDRSFTNQIDDTEESDRLVSNLIDLGGTLGMNVTVEGVETLQQFERLKESGTSEFQGFLFSKPLSATELVASKMIEDLETRAQLADQILGPVVGTRKKWVS